MFFEVERLVLVGKALAQLRKYGLLPFHLSVKRRSRMELTPQILQPYGIQPGRPSGAILVYPACLYWSFVSVASSQPHSSYLSSSSSSSSPSSCTCTAHYF